MMTSPCCFIYSPPAIFRATARWYNTSSYAAASSFEFSPFSLTSDSSHLLDGGFYTPTPDAVVREPISPIADMMQRSMDVEFTKEIAVSLAKRLEVNEDAGGAAADAEVEAEAEGEGAENERHEDDGAATDGAEAKTAVAVSSSVDRELPRAQERKTHIKFFFVVQVLTEMADQINLELGRTPCDRSIPVLKWKDLVGHPKKKQQNGHFKLSVAALFNRTQTAIDLRLSEAEAAKMVKRIQVRIRSYRSSFKNCPNKIPDWKKSLLCEFPNSHGIKIF